MLDLLFNSNVIGSITSLAYSNLGYLDGSNYKGTHYIGKYKQRYNKWESKW
jgi:hypothetical protein